MQLENLCFSLENTCFRVQFEITVVSANVVADPAGKHAISEYYVKQWFLKCNILKE